MMGKERHLLYEVITCYLASQFRDGDVGFTGLTTGPKSVLYGTAMPVVAMRVAQLTHAPNLTLLFSGWCVNPKVENLRRIPDVEFGEELLGLPAEAHTVGYPNFVGYKRSAVSVGFCTAAQVDRFGSVNSTRIGPARTPKVRLVGPILLPEHFTQFGREVIMMPTHDRRTFVELVDHVSGLGHTVTRRYGSVRFPGHGPEFVVSPFGIFDFSGPEGSMSVRHVHPGVDRELVAESTGFEIPGLESAAVTPQPTPEQLRALRQIDPGGNLIPRD